MTFKAETTETTPPENNIAESTLWEVAMKSLVLFMFWLAVIVFSCSHETSSAENKNIDPFAAKRSVAQFAKMTYSQTGRSPLDYVGYGCWCGYGGKGTPVDGVDRCCQQHDWCYNHLIEQRICGRYEVYVKNYYYWGLTCYRGWGSSHCGRSLCDCDVTAVKCFKQNHFNNHYKNWNKKSC